MYIITDSIKSVNRIIRRNNYLGKTNFGLEAITAQGIAWQIIIEEKSKTGLSQMRLVNNNTASVIVLDLLWNTNVINFIPKESYCLATARELLNSINLLRMNNFDESVSDSKVQQFKEFITLYENKLFDLGLYDVPRVLKEAKVAMENGDVKKSSDKVLTCYFDNPSMLEMEFVKAYSGGNFEEFKKPSQGKDISYEFVKTYGIVNETDCIAKTIVDKNIPLGDVEIICNASLYMPHLEESFSKRSLSLSFVDGKSGAGLNKIQILKGLIEWYLHGCRYKELFSVMHNPLFAFECNGKLCGAGKAFLKGIDYGIGWDAARYKNVKRSSYDVEHNVPESDYNKIFRETELPRLADLAEEISKAKSVVDVFDALFNYVESHTFKRAEENKYTSVSLRNLRKSMSSMTISLSSINEMLEFVYNELESISVHEFESSCSASISSITKPVMQERKHIFILGLSAKEFKVSTADSPILSDNLKMQLFGKDLCGNVKFNKDALMNAENVICKIVEYVPDGAEVYLSSSCADILRDSSEVATSSIFEKLLSKFGKEASECVEYFDLSTKDTLVKHEDGWKNFESKWDTSSATIEKTFSKSSLDELLQCPLKYHYNHELHIPQEEYQNYRPDTWLPINKIGNLIHRVLELYCSSSLVTISPVSEIFDENCREFTNALEKAVSEMESEYPAPSEEIKNYEVEKYKKIIIDYLSYLHKDFHDGGWVVAACEEQIDEECCQYPMNISGNDFLIKFRGAIDRIDKKENSDGSFIYRIADYKTGSFKEEAEMEKETKQHLIYNYYILQKYGKNAESFDYLYISHIDSEKKWITTIPDSILGQDIFTAEDKDLLYEVFVKHNYKYDNGLDEKNKLCQYCRYTDICLSKLDIK